MVEYSEKDYTLKSDHIPFEISYYKIKEFFIVYSNYIGFIKGCESFIRKSNDYREYISAIKEIGLTKCQVLGNIDSSDADTEMHHGPIFTLFDYCAVMLSYMIKSNIPISTPKVAKRIMDEHWEGNIQTVMLSTTAHQAVDSGRLFISLKSAYGNLNNFIKKYRIGISDNQKNKINEYIRLCGQYNSTDNGLFDLKETMYNWNEIK